MRAENAKYGAPRKLHLGLYRVGLCTGSALIPKYLISSPGTVDELQC
jgi:hypothetical protein